MTEHHHPVRVRVANIGSNPLPEYATPQSAGLDLRARLDGPVVLQPGERRLVPTGLHIELPDGFEAQVRPRSGLAYKHGVTVLNSPGTIDADYRGDIGVIVSELSFDIIQRLFAQWHTRLSSPLLYVLPAHVVQRTQFSRHLNTQYQ